KVHSLIFGPNSDVKLTSELNVYSMLTCKSEDHIPNRLHQS
ncbi:unnamed protein product, partial [Macrosiphum euphorbiae]